MSDDRSSMDVLDSVGVLIDKIDDLRIKPDCSIQTPNKVTMAISGQELSVGRSGKLGNEVVNISVVDELVVSTVEHSDGQGRGKVGQVVSGWCGLPIDLLVRAGTTVVVPLEGELLDLLVEVGDVLGGRACGKVLTERRQS